jgi:hypothetical protein
MTTRYVDGVNGNNSWDGLSPVFVSGSTGPKATLTGMEATPVAAGDLVHVRAGVYRELLTLGVSGTAGNPIEYRGDYAGLIWAGSGGEVRITGSNNDLTSARTNCIALSARSYRTFTNFRFDLASGAAVTDSGSAATNIIVQNCVMFVYQSTNAYVYAQASGSLNWTIQNCLFFAASGGQSIQFSGTTVSNSGHLIQNCVFLFGSIQVRVSGVGGITIKNCVHLFAGSTAIRIVNAIPAGQTVVVNNCIIANNAGGLQSTTSTELAENYNTFNGNGTDRSTTAVGANSITTIPLFDARWFMQLVTAGAGPNNAAQVVSPFDLSAWSQLINVAGTSPATTDMRGTAVIGSQREFGALEYDSTLKIKSAAGGSGISRSRAQ